MRAWNPAASCASVATTSMRSMPSTREEQIDIGGPEPAGFDEPIADGDDDAAGIARARRLWSSHSRNACSSNVSASRIRRS